MRPSYRLLIAGILATAAISLHMLPRRWPDLWTEADGLGDAPISRVDRRAKPVRINFTRALSSMNQIDVKSRLAGQVTEIRFKTGERVAANAVVAKVESKNLAQTIAGIEARLRIAQDELAQRTEQLAGDEKQLAEAREYYGQDLIARRELDEASASAEVTRAQVQLAQARVAQQQAMLAQARAVERYTQVITPSAGVVVRRWVEVGATIAQSAVILTVADADQLKLIARIAEDYSEELREGMTATVVNPNDPAKSFMAKLARVTRGGNIPGHELEVELHIKSDRSLRPGMMVEVTLVSDSRREAL